VNVFQLGEQRICIAVVSVQIVTHDLDIDWSRQAKVEDLADHVGRQEGETNAGKLFWQCETKVLHVLIRGMVLRGESHKMSASDVPTGAELL